MVFKSIKLSNFLSFGEMPEPVQLGQLNILIGPNGAGKSNFIEAFRLLQAAPRDLFQPINQGGGVDEWLRKTGGDSEPSTAALDLVVDISLRPSSRIADPLLVRYMLEFGSRGSRAQVEKERIEDGDPHTDSEEPDISYAYDGRSPSLEVHEPSPLISEYGSEDERPRRFRRLCPADINLGESVLSQYRGMDDYPVLTLLALQFAGIRIYTEWTLGRHAAPRLPQRADMPNDHLEPDASNLGLVLNRIRRDIKSKQRLLTALRELYDGIEDYDVRIEGNTVQVFLQEKDRIIPATRLSDGTLRYLSLLAILCNPEPGSLVCIEEPELGLHPDVLPGLAELLREASEKTQLIVTTHSSVLVDDFSDRPEVVLVTENSGDGTRLERLNKEKLSSWLEKYRLGELWARGDIGGNRW